MLLLAAWLALPVHALQTRQSGPTLELGIGPALAGRPSGFAGAGQLSLGWWVGPYDDAYALGRFWALVLTGRADVGARSAVRIAPLIELRRGMDLLVLAPHGFVAAGPLLALGGEGGAVGGTVRAGGGLKLRRSRRLGFTARLEAGVDVLDRLAAPVVALTLGGGWSSPLRRPR